METLRASHPSCASDPARTIATTFKLMGRSAVCQTVDLTPAKLRRRIERGTFPTPLILGLRKHPFVASEIVEIKAILRDHPDHVLQVRVMELASERRRRLRALEFELDHAARTSWGELAEQGRRLRYPWRPIKSVCVGRGEAQSFLLLPFCYGEALNRRRTKNFPVEGVRVGSGVFINLFDVLLLNVRGALVGMDS